MAQKNLSRQFPRHFGCLNSCFEFAKLVASSLHERNIPIEELDVKLGIYSYFLFDTTNSLKALYRLVDDGFIEDAKTLARKIIESHINLSYMSIDFEAHSRLFLNYEAFEQFRILQDIRQKDELANLRTEIEQNASRIIENYDNIISSYPKDKKTGDVQYRFVKYWSGKSMHEMAKDCKLEKLYSVVYKLFSYSSHPTVMKINNYIDWNNSKIGFEDDSTDEVPALIVSAINSFIGVFNKIIAGLEIKLESPLRLIHDELSKLNRDLE